jgi:hypothetical protein
MIQLGNVANIALISVHTDVNNDTVNEVAPIYAKMKWLIYTIFCIRI